jgi:hypothetical protein
MGVTPFGSARGSLAAASLTSRCLSRRYSSSCVPASALATPGAGFEPATFGLMTPTPLKRPRNVRTAPTERTGHARDEPSSATATSFAGAFPRLYMCPGAANRPRTCSGRQRRTHLTRQRRQRPHRGAMDRQPASSALVAARAATATLRQRYGSRRGGRHYLHRRRRAAPSLLRHTRTARRLFR